MTSVATGQRAEGVAARFLEYKGCRIVCRNWRTRMCEIDIVAERNGTLYFCEVKYRASARQGTGLDYITAKKLQQMQFAARSWVHAHAYAGDYRLCAIEVSGPRFQITAAINDLTV
ncbi:MAG TPA: YraN family protein [Patescibacteria group bacterium]|nr:YraN family protein [Patescibacteria group bacterium]